MPSLTEVIVVEIHHAITKLGGSAKPKIPEDAQQTLQDLGADPDLRSIVDSWQDTLDDQLVLDLLRNWNGGVPLFAEIYASRPNE